MLSTSGNSKRSAQTPLTSIVNISQDFSVPPPPLRLPLHVQTAPTTGKKSSVASIKYEVNSNILKKLEDFVFESLGSDKENNKEVGDLKQISKEVALSWQENIEQLEKIYEAVLSEESADVSKLTENLAKVNNWEGKYGVTKEQVLGWTEEFLVKVGMKTGSDTEERFM